jgi:phage terminase small subunit
MAGKRAARLTPKQERFVQEYLVDLDATKAAIRAGYSEKTAAAIGYENLRKPHVNEAVEKAKAERSERTLVTVDQVVEELAKIGFSNMTRVASWGPDGSSLKGSSEISEGDARCVSEVSVNTTVRTDKYGDVTETVNARVKLHDKLSALKMLGQHLGMFVERKEVTGKDGGPVEHRHQGFDLAAEVRKIDREIAAQAEEGEA